MKRPTRTVVVNQDPAPANQVPQGTQVTITTAVKETIPLSGLSVSDAVKTKWQTAGNLLDAVDGAQNAEAVKEVLAKKQSFDDLSEADRSVAQDFLSKAGGITGGDQSNAFDDVSFVFNL